MNIVILMEGGVSIGDECSISIYAKIVSDSHELDSDSFKFRCVNIIIEDHVFLGAAAIVLENTHIKSGAVIVSESVAKGNFEKNKIYAGNPIRPIKERHCCCDYMLYHDVYFR